MCATYCLAVECVVLNFLFGTIFTISTLPLLFSSLALALAIFFITVGVCVLLLTAVI